MKKFILVQGNAIKINSILYVSSIYDPNSGYLLPTHSPSFRIGIGITNDDYIQISMPEIDEINRDKDVESRWERYRKAKDKFIKEHAKLVNELLNKEES